MNQIKLLGETPDTVTLSRPDFDALIEGMENAEDRVAILEDCLVDMQPEQSRYLLTLAETMRIIDGENPIRVWREKRGMSRTQLAVAVGLHDKDLAVIENGGPVSKSLVDKLADALLVSQAQLRPVVVAP
jgi:DNA-binding XRE family transcriptional regulator